jgi:hypothetical protein
MRMGWFAHCSVRPTEPPICANRCGFGWVAWHWCGTGVPGAGIWYTEDAADLVAGPGLAYDTIRRATALLRERGLILTIIGRGTYVAPGASGLEGAGGPGSRG